MPKGIGDFKSGPKRLNVNEQITTTTNDIEKYVNLIKARPDDFAHQQLEILKQSIKNTEKALVDYQITDDRSELKLDDYFTKLDTAISFLIKKGEEEKVLAQADQSHAEKANELTVAINTIKLLVVLLQNVRDEFPIRPVDLSDESYETGKKVEKTRETTFNDEK